MPDSTVGIGILCDLAAAVGGWKNGPAPPVRGHTGGRGRTPQNRAWPAPFGAAGGTGRKWRFCLPEIPQTGGRHPYPDPVQTACRQQKRRHFCRYVLRKRYATCVTLFGICTDVLPGPAGCRL